MVSDQPLLKDYDTKETWLEICIIALETFICRPATHRACWPFVVTKEPTDVEIKCGDKFTRIHYINLVDEASA